MIGSDQDHHFLFSNCLIEELSQKNRWCYETSDPDYLIHIKLKNFETDHIGYRYDRIEATSNLIDRLIPIEGRLKIKVEVEVEDCKNQQILSSFSIDSEQDFDFVNYDTYKDLAFINEYEAVSVLSYSLGQLDSYQGAQESLTPTLLSQAAKKIALILQNL